jgi:hypothetical protein
MSDDVRLGLIIGGAGLVALAVLWRYLHRRRETHLLRQELADTEPQERARGGIALVDLGLSRAAGPLLTHVATEPDGRVRLAIALAIGRRQWEPGNTARVRQIREWAALELQRQDRPMTVFGPAVTRLADMGGPRPPEEPPTTPEPDVSIPAELAKDPVGTIAWERGATSS